MCKARSRCVRFSTAVDTCEFRGESHYDCNDTKAELWYSKQELSSLMNDLLREVKLIGKANARRQRRQDAKLVAAPVSPTSRGIEHLINKTASKRRKALKESVITWVLTEQDRQRERGESNPAIIANMSMLLSLEHIKDATRIGQSDEEYVKTTQDLPQQQVELATFTSDPTAQEEEKEEEEEERQKDANKDPVVSHDSQFFTEEWSFSSSSSSSPWWSDPATPSFFGPIKDRDAPPHLVEAFLPPQEGYLPVVAVTAAWEESNEHLPLLRTDTEEEEASSLPFFSEKRQTTNHQRDLLSTLIKSSFLTMFAQDVSMEIERGLSPFDYARMQEDEEEEQPERKRGMSFRSLSPNKRGMYDFVPFTGENDEWEQ